MICTARTSPAREPDGSSRRASLRYPNRLTLDLSQDDDGPLLGARYADRLATADCIRALVSLGREDTQLAEAVGRRAHELMPPPPGLIVLPPHGRPVEAPSAR